MAPQPRYNRTSEQVSNARKGYAPEAAWAKVSEFQLIAEPTLTPTTLADTVTISTDHTFRTNTPDFGFTKLYSTPKDNQVTSASPGDMGVKNKNFVHTLFMPGDDPQTQAMVESMMNQPLIALVEEANSPEQWIQYGSRRTPAYVQDAVFTSGNVNGESVKGWKIDIFSPCRYWYTGVRTYQA